MRPDEFSDATLIIFGHGSTVNEQSSAPVFQHASEIRRRGLFKQVLEGFWKQEPQLHDVLRQVSEHRIFLAPLFISEGYFSEQVIPAELGFRIDSENDFGRVVQLRNQTRFYCRAIGTHPAMTKVVLNRAAEVVAKFPFPTVPKAAETTLFIAGHGTEQNAGSRVAIDLQVGAIRARHLYPAVHALFLDEEPRIQQAYALCHTRNMVVVPFFISDGTHVQEDIPVLLGEAKRVVRERLDQGASPWRNPAERNRKLVWLSGAVGSDPSVAEVILERVREAAGWKAPS